MYLTKIQAYTRSFQHLHVEHYLSIWLQFLNSTDTFRFHWKLRLCFRRIKRAIKLEKLLWKTVLLCKSIVPQGIKLTQNLDGIIKLYIEEFKLVAISVCLIFNRELTWFALLNWHTKNFKNVLPFQIMNHFKNSENKSKFSQVNCDVLSKRKES